MAYTFQATTFFFNQMYMNIVQDFWNHYTSLGNCPPTPPLGQHFALSENNRTQNTCWEVSDNVGLGEGYVGSFPETNKDSSGIILT